MPSRSDWLAASPKCGRTAGSMTTAPICGQPLVWHSNAFRLRHPSESDWQHGRWVCPKHGPCLDGVEAAVRAGFRMAPIEEAA